MSFSVQWGLKAPMRDGTRLDVTAYLPDASPPRPAIVTMSPYMGDLYHELGRRFAAAGFPCLFADVRGRGESEGAFEPHIQEGPDGYDLLAWARAQPFCDGRIMMRGASYCGYAQWVTAAQHPEGLISIVPTASPFPGHDVPFRRNIFPTYLVRWRRLVSGRTARFNAFADEEYWTALFERWRASGASLADLCRLAGDGSSYFDELLAHPHPDAYWTARVPGAEQYRGITQAVLTITGQFDGDQPGALEHYRRHRAQCPDDIPTYLLIGPWDHGGTSNPAPSVEGEPLGAAAMIDMAALHLEWYSWILGEGARPALLADQVTYYVIGKDRWESAPDLRSVTARHLRMTLALDAVPSDPAFLLLSAAGGEGGYSYDPADHLAPERRLTHNPEDWNCSELYEALGTRKLVFETSALDEDLVVAGFCDLRLWLAIDTPDTDIFATLFIVFPSGTMRRLCADAVRARYRASDTSPELLGDAAPREYKFDRFRFIARLIPAGAKLRLVISPVALDGDRYEVNWNAGGIVSEQNIADARTATVTLSREPAHQSYLDLPIARAPSD